MTFKIYWRRETEELGRWASFSDREDAEGYLAALKDSGTKAALYEIPSPDEDQPELRWSVHYYNDSQWREYDRYKTKAEAYRVCKFLREQGNLARVCG